MIIPRDMPKLESPFIRKTVNGKYVVTPEIVKGYEWVFEDTSAIATEKLDGTDVSIIIESGVITSVYNRTNRVQVFTKEKDFITRGILNSYVKGYCDLLPDGQWFGELIGPPLNGMYRLKEPLWLPFPTYVREHLAYKSWGKYPKTFESISTWFKDGPMSLLFGELNYDDRNAPDRPLAEGVVFHHPDGRMAKLRRDMFDWYSGPSHKETSQNFGEMTTRERFNKVFNKDSTGSTGQGLLMDESHSCGLIIDPTTAIWLKLGGEMTAKLDMKRLSSATEGIIEFDGKKFNRDLIIMACKVLGQGTKTFDLAKSKGSTTFTALQVSNKNGTILIAHRDTDDEASIPLRDFSSNARRWHQVGRIKVFAVNKTVAIDIAKRMGFEETISIGPLRGK